MSRLGFHKEILSAVWQLRFDVARQAANQILYNKEHAILQEDIRRADKVCSKLFFKVEGNALVPSNGFYQSEYYDCDGELDADKESCDNEYRINMYNIDGVITRNGGGCSLGSKTVRDDMIAAANDEHVLGHIFILDSPGGVSNSAYDFEQGIDAARKAGQPVIGLIDGECASACLRLAVKFDKLFYVNEHDQIGSVGTMAMFSGNKNGDVNSVTQEKYVEMYADASVNKNGFYRKALDDDFSELKELLNNENQKFIDEVKEARPNVTEEMLTGTMFECGEVVGVLVDGQATLKDCCDMIIKGFESVLQSEPEPQHNTESINNNNSHEMDKYPKLVSALGVEPEMNEEGFFLNAALAQTLEEKLNTLDQNAEELADTKSQLTAANERIEDLLAQVNSLTEISNEVENLKKASTELQTNFDNMKSQFDEAKTQLDAFHEVADSPEAVKQSLDNVANLQSQIEELNNTIAQKDKEIEELADTGTHSDKPKTEGGNDAGIASPLISETAKSREEMLKMFAQRSAKLKNA